MRRVGSTHLKAGVQKGGVRLQYKRRSLTLKAVKRLTPKKLDNIAERVHRFFGYIKRDIK